MTIAKICEQLEMFEGYFGICLHHACTDGKAADHFRDAVAAAHAAREILGGLPHLMTAEEFLSMRMGSGWIEWYPDDEAPEGENVMRAAWVDGRAIMLDLYGAESTGPLPAETYNKIDGFRVWTGQPTAEQRKEAAWDGQP